MVENNFKDEFKKRIFELGSDPTPEILIFKLVDLINDMHDHFDNGISKLNDKITELENNKIEADSDESATTESVSEKSKSVRNKK